MKNIYLEKNNHDKKIKNLQVYSIDLIRKGILSKNNAENILNYKIKVLNKNAIYNFIANFVLKKYC